MLTQRIESLTNLPSKAFLIALENSGTQRWEVNNCLFIGRSTENEVQIATPFISRRHAKIESIDGSYYLYDLRSQNGTYINACNIKTAILNEGDKIKIGDHSFLFTFKEKNQEVKITSRSKAFKKQIESLPNIATTELPVLLLGDSGCGKEVYSKYIHENSFRRKGPLVTINCSALSSSVIESELFGHKKGSFTDASSSRKGAFESARGGTLVLDEIGDLPLDLQPKLLRSLENKEIRPVGSDITINTDVRIIASTHKDIKKMVFDGDFRKDLYFRLNIISFHLPKLKDRMQDFEDLLYSFAKEMRVSFSLSAIKELKKHNWPGNIRELKNVVSRASALFQDKKEITELDIPSILQESDAPFDDKKEKSLSMLKDLERELIIKKLIENKGNQRQSAIQMGLPTSTLCDKIKKLNIDIDQIKALQ